MKTDKVIKKITLLLCILLAFSTPAFSEDGDNLTIRQLREALSPEQSAANNKAAAAKQTVAETSQNVLPLIGTQTANLEVDEDPLSRTVPQPTMNPFSSQMAYQDLLNNNVPLSPSQIVELHRLFNQSKQAAATSPGKPPRPVASSLLVQLAPGSTPPAVRLAAGFVSSLVFIDSTGAPWPIASYDLGDPKSFNIQWDRKSNIMMIQASSLYTYGNLAVRLRNLSTPVMLTLIPGQKLVDYRVDLRIPGRGPKATITHLGGGLPATANTTLMSLLDGVPPVKSKRLKVTGDRAEAWLVDGMIFLRMRSTLLSPAWVSKVASADGMHAYQLQKTSALLASKQGKLIKLKVEGF